MSRLPDLVLDSRLRTQIYDSRIIHSYLEINEAGGRFSREEHWKWERFLGYGGSGQVRLQRCITKSAMQDSLRAVKIIHKPMNLSESLDFNRELEAIAKFSNDRYKRWFVKSLGWYEDPSSIFITMEYCRHGDLHHYLRSKRLLPAGEVQQLTYQILEGLDQMHQSDFAHRDLKPGNILIKSMPPEKKWWVVLADFGISKRANETNGPTTTIKGTATFMAPELSGFLDQVRPKSIADFKATDMWALGEIIFQMLTGETTFQNPMELMTYCLGQREFPSNNRLLISAGDDGREFVTSIMMALPHDRMTTTQCFQHRWMESLLVEEEPAALNLEQTGPLVPDISRNESNSARWSSLSDLEHRPLQTTAQWKPASYTHSNSSGARQTQLESRYSSSSIQQYPNADQESLVLMEMALVQTLKGHSNYVTAVEFSPDGKRLASASDDKTVRLWEVVSGKLVQILEGHSKYISTVEFSPDGKRLVSASYDKTVRLWDAGSGKLVQILEGHSKYVTAVEFSPDGKRLASASNDKTVRLWDAGSGKLVQILEGHSNYVYAVAFSPDSKRLVSASNDKTVRLWDAVSGKLVQILEGHLNYISTVAFSPDGKRLVSASYDTNIRLWDAGPGKLVQILEGHSKSVNAVTFSPDGKRLASASNDKTVRLWDAGSGKLVQILEGHSSYVYAVAFSPDCKRLASASNDKTVRLWDAGSGKLVQILEGHLNYIRIVAFSPDGKRLVSASYDKTVRLWDAGSGKLVQILEGHSKSVNAVTFSPDGKRLASASWDNTVRLWGADIGKS